VIDSINRNVSSIFDLTYAHDPDDNVFTVKMNEKSVFSELMQLQNFPFDEQALNVILSCKKPSVTLVEDKMIPYRFQMRNFQLGAVFSVTHKELFLTVMSLTNPNESSVGESQSCFNIAVLIERKENYYISKPNCFNCLAWSNRWHIHACWCKNPNISNFASYSGSLSIRCSGIVTSFIVCHSHGYIYMDEISLDFCHNM
jgi:hypothetical protein